MDLKHCVLLLGLIFVFPRVGGMYEDYYRMKYVGTPYGGNHLYNIRCYNSPDSEKVMEVADDVELAKYNSDSISDLQLRLVGGNEKRVFDCSIYSNLQKLHIIANVEKLIIPSSLEELRLDSSYVGVNCTLDLSVCKKLKAFCSEREINRLILPPSLIYLKLSYTSGHKSTVEGLENCNLLSQLDVDWADWCITIPKTLKFLTISGYAKFDLLDLSHCSKLKELKVSIVELKRLVLPIERPDEYHYFVKNNKPLHSCESIENIGDGNVERIWGDVIVSKYIQE